MSDILGIVALALVALALIALGYWLLIASEGVYLGRRVVIWLYDLYAGRYDDIKQYSKEYDHMLLAQPLMAQIAPVKTPLILDVATGTARMPLALLRHRGFQGRVIGADLSRRMLGIAAYKLGGEKRTNLILTPAERLPFPDNTFDAVTCLEALEFMSSPDAVLAEIARVLRPGGLLFTSNRINTRLMPGKTRSDDDLRARLEALGMEHIVIEYWQVDYNRVWAKKRGTSTPTLARPLAEILRCPRCQQSVLTEQNGAWHCPKCRYETKPGEDGVIDLRVD